MPEPQPPRGQVGRGVGEDRDASHGAAPLLRPTAGGRSMPGMIRAASTAFRLRCPRMDRSMWAVLVGTFTLRFSTGLTGACWRLPRRPPPARRAGGRSDRRRHLLGDVLPGRARPLADLRRPVRPHRPPPGDAVRTRVRGDRGDHHRAHDEPAGARRHALLEGASTAASVPSILGFIAFATAGDECCAARRRPGSRARRSPGSVAGFVVGADRCSRRSARSRSSSTRSSTASRSSSTATASRTRPASATPTHRHRASGLRRYVAALRGAPTSGCWRRPGSPSTPRSGCGSARRCSSSSASRTPSSPTSC